MNTSKENNRRIARNTLMLYFRTAITMVVSLFTSRVILNALGVSDYGIYSVVGGVVMMFTFLNTAMSSATQRFINFELGRNNLAQVARVFSVSLSAHLGIAVLVVLLAETIGLWFLNARMMIPDGRMAAANWVFQMSIFATVVGIVRVPYNATILAHERMSFYAGTSIGEALLRLGIVWALVFSVGDKLKLYSSLVLAVSVFMWLAHYVYCRRIFKTAYHPAREITLAREIIGFSGWSLLGGLANMCNTQGINLVFNLFYGVVVNAAMGIASQVNAAIFQFVFSFQMAFNPQIVKSYALGNYEYCISLVFRASKFSFYLLLLLALPMLFNTEPILKTWLELVPPYAPVFLRLIVASALVDALAGPLWMSAHAIGNIRNYQVVVSLLVLSNLPLAYAVLSLGYSPAWVLALRVAINLLALLWRVWYFCVKMRVPLYSYFLQVMLPVLSVLVLAAVLPAVFNHMWTGPGAWIVSSILAVGCVVGSVWVFGLTPNERDVLMAILRKTFAGEGVAV